MRGLLEAVALKELEKELKAPVSEVFDMVAGSSIGGLIALALTVPNEEGKARFSAQDLVDLFLEHNSEVFYASTAHKIKTLGGLIGPKYESTRFKSVLEDYFGSAKISEALIPTMITAYHVAGNSGIEFSSYEAKDYPQDKDCFMKDVALATTAAPVFFDSVDIDYPWGKLHDVVDGGLYSNNPALLAYINAKKLFPDDKIEIYSFGAGIMNAEDLGTELKGRGIMQWISPLIRHLILGDSESNNTVLHKLLNEDNNEGFFRLNIYLENEHREMDDIREENIDYLYNKGIELSESENFKDMIARLKERS